MLLLSEEAEAVSVTTMAASSNKASENQTQNQQLNLVSTTFEIPVYILDDLCSRFIINIPDEERTDLIRIFFQIELAHWFYLDFYCQENIDLKPCGIKEFSKQIFRHCPTLIKHADDADKILLSWREYKMAVPTYGAIILDPSLQYCLLVQGFWAKASWGFPKGKVNEGELAHDCAVREVLEETGFDISSLIDKEEFIEFKMSEQLNRLYIIHPVSMETKFMPQTRKEIKKLEWFSIDHLPSHKKDMMSKQHTGLNPNAFFMVIPFIKPLRRWIARKQGHHGSSDTNMSGSYVNYKSGRSGKHRDKQGGEATDKQRPNQRKFYQQQIPGEYQETKKQRSRTQGQNDGIISSTQHKITGMIGNKHVTASPKQPSTKKHEKQYHILKRDGTVSGNIRRTLEYDTDHSSAYIGYKSGNQKNKLFFSPSLANFHLDIDSVFSAMFPALKNDR